MRPIDPPPRGLSFHGCAALIADAVTLILGGAPVLVLTGPAGIGKSRVARELLAEPALARLQPALRCDLGAAEDEATMLAALGWTLGLNLDTTTAPAGRARLGRALAHAGHPIVCLDDIDRVSAPAAAALAEWRVMAPDVVFLVTSRRPLGGDMRHITIAPLPDASAVALFCDRARRLVPTLPELDGPVTRIAHAIRPLGGLPLAIELAAPWLQVFDLDALAERLRSAPLPWLGGGHGRFTSIEHALGWSWGLLPAAVRTVALHAALFRGPFLADALFGISDPAPAPQAAAEALRALIEHRLVEPITDGGPRRFRLQPLVRAFIDARWDPAARAAAAERHARWFTRPTAAIAGSILWANASAGAVPTAELPDLQAAMAHRSGAPTADALTALSAHRILLDCGPRVLHEASLARVVDDPAVAPRVRLLARLAQGQALWGWRDAAAARAAFAAVLEDAAGHDDILASVSLWSAYCAGLAGDRAAAEAHLARLAGLDLPGDGPIAGEILHHRAMDRLFARDEARGRALLVTGLALAERADNDGLRYVFHMNLGYLHLEAYALDDADRHRRAALAAARRLGGARDLSDALSGLGFVCLKRLQLEEAERRVREARALDGRTGNARGWARASHLLGHIRLARGHHDEAATLLATAEAALRAVGEPAGAVLAQATTGLVHLLEGRPAMAIGLFEAAAALLGRGPDTGRALWNARLAALARALDAPDGEAHTVSAAGELPSRLEAAGRMLALATALAEGPTVELRTRAAAVLARVPTAATIEDQTARRILGVTVAIVDARSGIGPALMVQTGGRGFRLEDAPWVDLSRRTHPARLLAALADLRRRLPGHAFDFDALFARGWPGEQAVPRAMRQRVHTAIYTLRRAGLGRLIQRHEAGYRIDPMVRVDRVQAPPP